MLATGEPLLAQPIEIETPQGSHRCIIMSAIPIFKEGGQVGSVIVVNQDISEQKQVERELAEVQRQLLANAEAERLKLAQDLHDGPIQDLYGVSYQMHELRDPWNTPISSRSRRQSLKRCSRLPPFYAACVLKCVRPPWRLSGWKKRSFLTPKGFSAAMRL